MLDLVLLKLGVYRHLIYNRGTPPRRLKGRRKSDGNSMEENVEGANPDKRATELVCAAILSSRPVIVTLGAKQQWKRWLLLLQLGCALVVSDACKLSLPS